MRILQNILDNDIRRPGSHNMVRWGRAVRLRAEKTILGELLAKWVWSLWTIAVDGATCWHAPCAGGRADWGNGKSTRRIVYKERAALWLRALTSQKMSWGKFIMKASRPFRRVWIDFALVLAFRLPLPVELPLILRAKRRPFCSMR